MLAYIGSPSIDHDVVGWAIDRRSKWNSKSNRRYRREAGHSADSGTEDRLAVAADVPCEAKPRRKVVFFRAVQLIVRQSRTDLGNATRYGGIERPEKVSVVMRRTLVFVAYARRDRYPGGDAPGILDESGKPFRAEVLF